MERVQATLCEAVHNGCLCAYLGKSYSSNFGESDTLHEQAVQEFVLQKIENGLNVKSVKDILIVLKMVMKFGVKK